MKKEQSSSPDGGADHLNLFLGRAALPPSSASTIAIGDVRNTEATEVQTHPSQPRSWRWMLVGLSTCGALSSVAAAALLWMFMLPPAPDCQSISPLTTDMERLYCAQEAARSGNLPELLAGLATVETWSSDHPLYHEAQRWVKDWSESVLAIAHQKVEANDLKGAVATARQIPQTSPVFADAQEAIARWQEGWQEGEAVSAEVQTALKAQNWELASAKIRSMADLEQRHWHTERSNALIRQLAIERRARQALAKAISLAKPGKLKNLSAAIASASQIDHKTYAWVDAQTALNGWSDTLLTVGFAQWKAQKLDQAIAIAQQVSHPGRDAEAQNLIRLSEARKLVISTVTNWQPSPQHTVNLMEAVAAARQIPPSSRFYAQAQDSLASWQAQLEGVKTLQIALVTANLGQPDALKLAIAQAQTIAPSHPRRVQAQTLIAHWHNEQERLADNPVLVRARQLAAPGTIPAMRLAIAQANQIAMGRTLRGEAQGLAYSWTRQIETIEDRPYLSMARTLAQRGRLAEAIRSAALVRSGRALYPQAQAAIRGWRADLRRAEMRTIAAGTPRSSSPTTPPRPQSRRVLQTSPSSVSTTNRSSTRPAAAVAPSSPVDLPNPPVRELPTTAGDRLPASNSRQPILGSDPSPAIPPAAELAPPPVSTPVSTGERSPQVERVPAPISESPHPAALPRPVQSEPSPASAPAQSAAPVPASF